MQPVVRVTIVGSGSGGNATLFESGGTRVLVDAGLSARRVRNTVRDVLHLSLDSLDGIVLTHAHGDHVGHAARVSKVLRARVWITPETQKRIQLPAVVPTRSYARKSRFRIGGLKFDSSPVPHDAPQVALVVRDQHDCVGIVTDLGRIPKSLPKHLARCRTLLLESNHDLELLRMAPYPAFVRNRIAGVGGHLANEQTAALLSALRDGPLERVVLMHLSQKANSPAKAARVAREALGPDVEILVAAQDRPLVLEGTASAQLSLAL